MTSSPRRSALPASTSSYWRSAAATVTLHVVLVVPWAWAVAGEDGALLATLVAGSVIASTTGLPEREGEGPWLCGLTLFAGFTTVAGQTVAWATGALLAATTRGAGLAGVDVLVSSLFGAFSLGFGWTLLVQVGREFDAIRPNNRDLMRSIQRVPRWVRLVLVFLVVTLLGANTSIANGRDRWIVGMLSGIGFIGGYAAAIWTGPAISRGLRAFAPAVKLLAIVRLPVIGYLTGYAVIVFAFASWFTFVQAVNQQITGTDAFGHPRGGSPPGFGEFLFISVTTITTVGYGGSLYPPQASLAAVAVSIESLIGFIWTVVVFAFLVAYIGEHLKNSDVGARDTPP